MTTRLGTEPLRVQDITSQQGHKGCVQQHTTSNRVADTSDDQVLDTVGTVAGPHAHSDGNTKGSNEGKDQDQDDGEPLLLEGQVGNTGAKSDTFKELVEADGDSHGEELGPREDTEGDADEDGVEGDTEFEHVGRDFCGDAGAALEDGQTVGVAAASVFEGGVVGRLGDVGLGGIQGVNVGGGARLLVLELGRVRVVMMVMVVILVVSMGMSMLVGFLDGTTRETGSCSFFALSLDIDSDGRSKELNNEHGQTRDHHDQGGIARIIIGPGLGETRVGESKEGLGEDVDKGDGENNTGTEVFSKLDGEAGAVVLTDHHGEDAAEASDDHEDKEGDDVVPDDVLAVVVVVRLACAILL